MFEPENDIAYDKQPLSLKVMPGVREALQNIPNWQAKLRRLLDIFIREEKEKNISQGDNSR
jgi:hypothetical protein